MSASGLESRMKETLSEARSSLRSLYGAASQAVEGRDITENATDAVLQKYLKVKSDTRALLTYYRDAAANSAVRPSIAILNSTVQHSNSSAQKKLGATGADDILVSFEQRFDLKYEGGSTMDQQSVRDEVFLLRQISELNALKENTLYKLINFFLEQLGIEHVVSERKHLPPNLEACSRELPMIFHFFKTFKSMSKTVALTALMKTPQDSANEINMQQIQIEQLQADVQARLSEIFSLRKRLDAASLQTERQAAIVAQQDKIATLEKELDECKKDMARMYEDYRREVQQKSYVNDQLVLMQAKLENARGAYDRDIRKMQPMLEEFVSKSQADLKEMQAIKNDSSLNAVRQQFSEKRVQQAEREQEAYQAKIKSLTSQVAEYAQTNKALQEENARQSRLKIVITAAKVRYHEMALAAEKRQKEAEDGEREMHGHCVAYANAVSNLQEYVRDLEAALKESEDENTELRTQLRFNVADVRSRELESGKMRKDMSKLQSSAGSALETTEELDAVKQDLAKAREEILRLEKQLVTAMQRIYELQGQLLDYQMGPVAGDEKLTDEDPQSDYYRSS